MRVVVADGQPLERQRLIRALEAQAAQVVASYGDGPAVIDGVRRQVPDAVFLEIQLPELGGLEVAAALARLDHPPGIVFVTPDHQYAVRAFDVGAIDYLLKPVAPARLRSALDRIAATRLPARPHDDSHLMALLSALTERERARGRDRLVVRTPARAFFLRTDSIDWVSAAGKFVRIHANKETHTVRQSMAALERRLDAGHFVRISRSTIVNLDRVQEIQPWFQGDYVLILADGTRFTSTRGYRESMRRLLGKSA